MRDIIYVENNNRLGVKGRSFILKNIVTKEELIIFEDDLSVIIFDNISSSLTAKSAVRCIERNILVIFCDNKFSPYGIISPDYANQNKVNILRSQVNMLQKTKNRLWTKIIKSKIKNQADCMKYYCFADIVTYNNLISLANNVTEGDKENAEANAARKYFQFCFGENFRRGRYNDLINAGLNYGYALVRSLIRKELVSHGFEPAIGIRHYSSENRFNLSDDIIEPYRAFVDALVIEKVLGSDYNEFNLELRKEMVKSVFLMKCVIGDKIFTLHDAVILTVQSLITCYQNETVSDLKLPVMIEL